MHQLQAPRSTAASLRASLFSVALAALATWATPAHAELALLPPGDAGAVVPSAGAAPAPTLESMLPPTPPPAAPLRARRRNHEHRTLQPLEAVDAHVVALLPYSALATEVYCEALFKAAADAPPPDCDTGWIGGTGDWQRLARWPEDLAGPHDFKGMRFAVYWRWLTPGHAEIGVAFRGTDFKSPADWHANLRWFHGWRTQYDVLAEIAPEVIRRSKAAIQARHAVQRWRITATGHSLGGGLAQLFAYKSTDVHAAVVFDPTPVTGYHGCVADSEVNCHVPVWRVYERGEVLSWLRSFTRLFYPLSENIVEIEFDVLGRNGNWIANHDMRRFHQGLREHDRARPELRLTAAQDLFAPVFDCTCARERRSFTWHQVQERCELLAGRSAARRVAATAGDDSPEWPAFVEPAPARPAQPLLAALP